jgi:hypothetical protein
MPPTKPGLSPAKAKRPYIPTGRPRGRPKGAKTRPKPLELLPMVKPAAMRLETAARYIGLSPSMLKKLAAQGRVQTVSVGRARLFLTASLDALLAGDQ